MMESSLSYRMQIRWNRKTTDWFRRASEYTGFHKKLSEILLAMMPEAETVCDLGCGAGMIDFYLKDHVKQVTCVDQVPEVISILEEEIREKSIRNMETACCDIRRLEGHWDTCIMLFVGASPEEIGRYLRLCRDRLLIVDRGGCRESLAKGEKNVPAILCCR